MYRFAGVPVDVTLDALRATWLSLDPAALAGERLDALRSGGPGAIVSHVSAAHYVYELGTLHPARLDYTVPAAPEASSPRVEFHVAERWSPPWQLVGGLPVTPVPQTIADVYRDGIDGGHRSPVSTSWTLTPRHGCITRRTSMRCRRRWRKLINVADLGG
ncbi:hypothetical protein [Mycobacterium avium]|uniref:hypothetical protein n=1 Tax=Mycobacterium avium TaxID=1764 RepID=UPI001CCD21CA|nr:hypothetical protein [Mycobacterium avium]MBZ4575432.1 hypothetical protein [Mycobacterium avium subsp. hominissuis]